MKRLAAGLALFLPLALLAGAHDEVRTFRGDIADSQCALNVHSLTRSHQEMLKSKAIGGSVSACAQYCIKYLGGDYVLSLKSKVYRLDNQSEAGKFAGEKVKITGTLASKSDTIHVIKIESEESQSDTSEKPVAPEEIHAGEQK